MSRGLGDVYKRQAFNVVVAPSYHQTMTRLVVSHVGHQVETVVLRHAAQRVLHLGVPAEADRQVS